MYIMDTNQNISPKINNNIATINLLENRIINQIQVIGVYGFWTLTMFSESIVSTPDLTKSFPLKSISWNAELTFLFDGEG